MSVIKLRAKPVLPENAKVYLPEKTTQPKLVYMGEYLQTSTNLASGFYIFHGAINQFSEHS